MSTTTDLDTLKINYLTQAQYDTALANNEINDDELYLTQTEDGVDTTTITTSTGTLVSHQIVRYGKVRSLRLTVKNSSAIAVGGNLYAGTITNSNDIPAMYANGSGYYNTSGGICQISNAGAINVRIIGAQLAANSEMWLCVTYIVA